MESYPRSMRDEFDRLTSGQNPTDLFTPPSSTTANGGSLVQDQFYTHQQPPLNSGFLVDNGAFPFMNKEQRRLPAAMGSHFAANPVRSILDYSDRYPVLSPEFREFNPYSSCCNSCHPGNIHPGLLGFDQQSSLNGFLETLENRNLEINFNRLNISSPNHHLMGTNLVPVNRNIRCLDMCCNPHSSRRDNCGLSPRVFNNVLDIPNPNNSSLLPSRQQQKRSKFPASLKDIRGKICMVAKDQEGCQFLQTKCEGGKPEDIEMIFNEIKDHIFELMTDASMNYLAQKLFKVCNERQMTHIVVSVISDDNNLTNICLNSHGTRAMQKLIELLKTAEHRSLMVSALRRITLTLTKNTNGHHVIQHCLKSFHVDEVQPILNVVADNCLDIATDKSGCCVLQLCVLHADEVSKERLITEIIENALDLSEHPYGNYVVQHILGMQIPEVTGHIMKKLAGNFVNLAMNKYASNVVEKCLKDATDDQSTPIIREIISSPNFLGLIQHPFGNYVAQSVLQIAKGSLREMMINKVQKEYAYLHSHPHGKRVLALARNSKPRGSPIIMHE
ncbi:hypothetical protein L1987_27021 [Smallanthus sonchifolius]|uniref:Uncharacterized protein n=1 Tax=Smallanthus sonchifolius TaxID=185202 RepID=A0ACB9ICC2_9ASTR|nr:hypothetical protein L1987_27021 [Smallanthus sonchifolius]